MPANARQINLTNVSLLGEPSLNTELKDHQKKSHTCTPASRPPTTNLKNSGRDKFRERHFLNLSVTIGGNRRKEFGYLDASVEQMVPCSRYSN